MEEMIVYSSISDMGVIYLPTWKNAGIKKDGGEHFGGIYLLYAFPGTTFACMLVELLVTVRSLSKPRQLERHQTKDLMTKTVAVYVLYKSLYISLPSSTKQEHEMVKICVVWETWMTMANFLCFPF